MNVSYLRWGVGGKKEKKLKTDIHPSRNLTGETTEQRRKKKRPGRRGRAWFHLPTILSPASPLRKYTNNDISTQNILPFQVACFLRAELQYAYPIDDQDDEIVDRMSRSDAYQYQRIKRSDMMGIN